MHLPNIEIGTRDHSIHEFGFGYECGVVFVRSTVLSGGVPMSSLMGTIEDIYADLEADVTEEEFRDAVDARIEKMGDLVDEEVAASLVASELGNSDADTVADIDPEMSDITFVAKVVSIEELRTFERDDSEGHVLNIECADETGRVRVAL